MILLITKSISLVIYSILYDAHFNAKFLFNNQYQIQMIGKQIRVCRKSHKNLRTSTTTYVKNLEKITSLHGSIV